MNNKKILITGATGFVGSYLARYLVEKGYTNIIALKRATSRMDMVTEIINKVTWVEGDVLDMPFLEDTLRGYGIEQIYHCAAVVSYDPRDRKEMYDININGTANIVNLALDFEVEKLVYVIVSAPIIFWFTSSNSAFIS